MSDQGCTATPNEVLKAQIMSASEPKNEREWWAHREIDRLRAALGEIAKQVKSVNLTEDGLALADFPGAYDDMIDVARNALKPNL